MVRVLVIGATGYLGLSIAQAFRRASFTVYGLTRSENKSKLLASNEIIPIVGSVEDSKTYLSVIESERIDLVVDASATYQGAQAIFQNLLAAAKARLEQGGGMRGPKLGYIYVSGMWIHGDSPRAVSDLDPVGLPHSIAQPPTMLGWRPALEREILAGSEFLNVAIVRPACMYGKNQSAFGLYFGPILGAVKGNEGSLKLAASKEAMMALVHVDDCAEGILAVASKIDILSSTGVFPVFDLVGCYENMGVIMERAAQILGFKGRLELIGPGDDMMAQAMCTGVNGDSYRAKSLLGWIPRKSPFVQELDIHVKAFVASY